MNRLEEKGKRYDKIRFLFEVPASWGPEVLVPGGGGVGRRDGRL